MSSIVQPARSPDAAHTESSARPRPPRIAVAHDWLVGRRGGEAVLEEILGVVERIGELDALYVMFDDGQSLSPRIDAAPKQVSWVGRLPMASGTLRRHLLPLYPSAVASLSQALARSHAETPIDLVISTSSAAIKGLRTPPRHSITPDDVTTPPGDSMRVPHLCYIHAPARYLWSRQGEYARTSLARRLGLALFAPSLRRWDAQSASHVTRFVANSTATAAQVREFYARESGVVHPPVDTAFFTPPPVGAKRGKHWLLVSALEPYKRVDLAIRAAVTRGIELRIVGDGSERASLERLASGRVRFLGRVGNDTLREEYRLARLLIFPQEEDFGIVAGEALACGLPVVARRAGGALDLVDDGVTGSMFDWDPAWDRPGADVEPSVRALTQAIESCPPSDADVAARCRASSMRFSREVFAKDIEREIDHVLATCAEDAR
ncbi:MAG: glycosyltransferase [Phycisphaerales bacterium]